MKKLLLAEDSDETRRFFTRLIKKTFSGEIFQASSGLELVEYLDNHVFDVVITDILMPQMDGDEALLQSKNLGSTPVVLLTALEGTEITERIMRLKKEGIDVVACLEKPVSGAEIRTTVEIICNG